MRLIKKNAFAGHGIRELFSSLRELGGGAGKLASQLASRSLLFEAPELAVEMEARGPLRVSVPRVWESQIEKDGGAGLISPCAKTIAMAEVDRRLGMARDGVAGWGEGEILAGLPGSWLKEALATSDRSGFESALSLGVERALAKQRIKDEERAQRAQERSVFLERDRAIAAALPPVELSDEMRRAELRFFQLDQELSAQKKPKPASMALLRWLSLKARGLEGAGLSPSTELSDGERAARGAAWREARGLRLKAKCAFGEPEAYADGPAESQEPSASPYMWVRNGGDRGSSFAMEGFDNPLAAARWLAAGRESPPPTPSKDANFLSTPEGDSVSANHGYAWEWASALIRAIEKEEMELSSAPGEKRKPKSI